MAANVDYNKLFKAAIIALGLVWVAFAYFTLANPTKQPLLWVENGKTINTDFSQDYQIGVIACSPERFQAYDPEVQNSVLDRLAYPMPPQQGQTIVIQCMPTWFVLMAPLSWLPMRESYYLFYASSLLCTTAGLYLLARKIGGMSLFGATLLLICFLTSAPTIYAARIGKSVLFFLPLLCCFFYFWVKRKSIPAGLSLGLALVRPQYSVIFLAPVVMRKQWKMLATIVTTQTVLLAASALTLGVSNVINYPSILFHHETREGYVGVNPQLMISLRGALSGFPQPIVLALSCAIFATVFFVLLKVFSLKETRKISDAWLLSLVLIAAMIVTPHSHYYDVIMLGIPAALTLSNQVKSEVGGGFAYSLWRLCFYVAPILSYGRLLYSSVPPAYIFLPLNLLLLIAGCIISFKKPDSPTGHDHDGTLEEKVCL